MEYFYTLAKVRNIKTEAQKRYKKLTGVTIPLTLKVDKLVVDDNDNVHPNTTFKIIVPNKKGELLIKAGGNYEDNINTVLDYLINNFGDKSDVDDIQEKYINDVVASLTKHLLGKYNEDNIIVDVKDVDVSTKINEKILEFTVKLGYTINALNGINSAKVVTTHTTGLSTRIMDDKAATLVGELLAQKIVLDITDDAKKEVEKRW